MNINITPSAVAVDTAANLLAFLELAKDPSKLKAVVDQIKEAQVAASAEVEKAVAIKAEADKVAEEAEKKAAQASNDLMSARSESARAASAVAEADAVRASAREDRNKFDDWMAVQREALAGDQAKVASDAASLKSRADELSRQAADLVAREQSIADAMAAAEGLRAEYEQKMADLKAMVG